MIYNISYKHNQCILFLKENCCMYMYENIPFLGRGGSICCRDSDCVCNFAVCYFCFHNIYSTTKTPFKYKLILILFLLLKLIRTKKNANYDIIYRESLSETVCQVNFTLL